MRVSETKYVLLSRISKVLVKEAYRPVVSVRILKATKRREHLILMRSKLNNDFDAQFLFYRTTNVVTR